ncbi:unnamed protein product [Paramecium primaurelia]|uniref:Uncharacterized protein n=1 Tax=Paramecium primaurelia TaxID=5886 RepID=A0A8S1LH81_PARPR|nr:unnamed protein product [Paramecium primaurelia]
MKLIAILFITFVITSCIYTPAERQFNQEALTGAYNYNNLPEPQNVSNCGDDEIQIDLFNFVGYMLQKADKASLSQLLGLKKEVDDYFNALPEEYTNCLYAEPEFVEMCTLYGLKETDKMEQITDKIYQYAPKPKPQTPTPLRGVHVMSPQILPSLFYSDILSCHGQHSFPTDGSKKEAPWMTPIITSSEIKSVYCKRLWKPIQGIPKNFET